jgi:Secretion system C-terminal sorting domain
MNKFYFLLFSIFVANFTILQAQCSSGIFENYLVLDTNHAGNIYYDLQATTANPDYQNAFLGSYKLGTTNMILNGAENKTYKCNGANIISGVLFYRVYPLGMPTLSFDSVQFAFKTNLNGALCANGQDQKWDRLNANINLLIGISTPGTYVLEVFTTADYEGCGVGTHSANNSGSYYTATFNVLPADPLAVTDANLFGQKKESLILLKCILKSDVNVKKYSVLKSNNNQQFTTVFESNDVNKRLDTFEYAEADNTGMHLQYKAIIELVNGQLLETNIVNVETENAIGNLYIYPNPAMAYIQLSNSIFDKKESFHYKIYNALLQNVLAGTVSINNNKIELSSLARGTYYILLNNHQLKGTFQKQ